MLPFCFSLSKASSFARRLLLASALVAAAMLRSSAGLAAGIDLCVQLVRADYGTDAAIRVARRMVVAPHRDGGQAQWLERPVPLPGHGLAAAAKLHARFRGVHVEPRTLDHFGQFVADDPLV